MNRIPLLLLAILCAGLFTSAGCLWSKKPKQNPSIPTDVEESFKQRWIARRMAELSASGEAPDGRAARDQAMREFAEKYEYTSAAKGYQK